MKNSSSKSGNRWFHHPPRLAGSNNAEREPQRHGSLAFKLPRSVIDDAVQPILQVLKKATFPNSEFNTQYYNDSINQCIICIVVHHRSHN